MPKALGPSKSRLIAGPHFRLAGVVSVLVLAVLAGYIVRTSRAAAPVGDLNNDNTVNIFDLSILLSRWGQAGTNTADLNADNTVNIFDLSILLSHWGQTATPTPTSTPTPTPTPTPTVNPTPTPSGTPTPGGFPNSSNTGYQHAPDYPGSLHTCSTPIQSNTTYSFCNFAGGVNVGSSSTAVSNVTFHGCWFHGNALQNALVALFGDNITFDYSSFTPDVAAPPAPNDKNYQYGLIADGGYGSHVAKLTVTHSDFWGFGNAIDVTGSTQAKPQVYRDNYIHDACWNNDTCPSSGGGYHTDGIGDLNTGDKDSYVVLDHNTIASMGNTNAIAYQYGPYDHFTVTNNYFSGFGMMIHIGPNGPTNSVFTGNTWGTDFQQAYFPLYGGWNNTSLGNTWSNNRVHFVPGTHTYYDGEHQTGLVQAADDGKFWTPSGVSSTDSSN